MNQTILRKGQWEGDKYPLRYWSNASGDLFDPNIPGEECITEAGLPNVLRRAYRELWNEDSGCLMYLAESEGDYGIAMIGEYDTDFADDCGMSMDELFESMRRDMAELAAQDSMWAAKFFACEESGFDNCHELIVFVPAQMPKRDFERACMDIQTIMWSDAKRIRAVNNIVRNVIESHEEVGDYDIVVNRTKFVRHNFLEVDISFKWRLNGWEKDVQKTDMVVKDSFGYWNIVGSRHPRFR